MAKSYRQSCPQFQQTITHRATKLCAGPITPSLTWRSLGTPLHNYILAGSFLTIYITQMDFVMSRHYSPHTFSTRHAQEPKSQGHQKHMLQANKDSLQVQHGQHPPPSKKAHTQSQAQPQVSLPLPPRVSSCQTPSPATPNTTAHGLLTCPLPSPPLLSPGQLDTHPHISPCCRCNNL